MTKYVVSSTLDKVDWTGSKLVKGDVVLGKGRRLFADGVDKKPLTLAESKSFASGIVILEFRRTAP